MFTTWIKPSVTEIEWNISSYGVSEYVTDIYMWQTYICDRHINHNEDNMEAPEDARKEVGPELNTNEADN